ncbi:hypothetical protein GCM10027167_73830 [Nocardia heshunensis]
MPRHRCTPTRDFRYPVTQLLLRCGADLTEISLISHADVGDPPIARYTRAGKRAGNRAVKQSSRRTTE